VERRVVGVRPGEKIHEEMITETDALRCVEYDDRYAILPTTELFDMGRFMEATSGKPVRDGFRYMSGENTEWLSVDALRELIRAHVDPSFEPL
jgi:FlaA1/EpsC-like NDP-sugar epimerase